MKKKIIPEDCYKRTNMFTAEDISVGTAVVGQAVRFDVQNRQVVVDLGYPWVGIIPEDEITIYKFTYPIGVNVPKQVTSVIGSQVRAIITDIVDEYTLKLSRKASMLEAWEEIQEGERYLAYAKKNIGSGCFIDIGNGITTLIPKKEISYNRMTDINIWIKKGDTTKIIVLSKECDGYKIQISRKQAYSNIKDVDRDLNIDDVVTARIGQKTDGGYFCEVTPGITGILDTEYTYKEGDNVTVYIKKIGENGLKLGALY